MGESLTAILCQNSRDLAEGKPVVTRWLKAGISLQHHERRCSTVFGGVKAYKRGFTIFFLRSFRKTKRKGDVNFVGKKHK
mgnify:CR=1 FL=1